MMYAVNIQDDDDEKKVTTAATKTRMFGHSGPGLHYKHVRTTIVLLMSSSVFREFPLKEQRAFSELREANFDLSAVTNLTLEHAYAKLDDELMERVQREFEFVPALGNIQDHGGCYATCALCGKGDSKDEGDNQDRLRYDFRLTNLGGGQDLWVGSNCIVNFALKVRGAETSEEARAILERSLREHLAMWKKEQWRAEHMDHLEIPQQWEEMKTFMQRLKYYSDLGSRTSDLNALGYTQSSLFYKTTERQRDMRIVTRFYRRSDYLTQVKQEMWDLSKSWLNELRWISNMLDRSKNLGSQARIDFLISQREERRAASLRKRPRSMEAAALKRKPRPMP